MAEFDDIRKAKERINEIVKLGDEIQKAAPYLNDIKANLDWYEKVCNEIPEKQKEIISFLDGPIGTTLELSPAAFTLSASTGATGSYYSASGDTRTIIQSYGSKHYHLIKEYDEINKTEDFIDRTLKIIITFREDLQEFNPYGLLVEARETYEKWKAGFASNSDLAKDIRAFQDIINGALHRARISTYDPIPKSYPDPSWPKMAEALAKKGFGCLKSLRYHQSTDDRLHLEFTEISKKTKDVDKDVMDRFFKNYIEHIYSILNLINEDFVK